MRANYSSPSLLRDEVVTFIRAQRQATQRWIESAAGETLFLDQIGEMPSHLQAKLLTLLQDSFVGSRAPLPSLQVHVVGCAGGEPQRLKPIQGGLSHRHSYHFTQ